jgi:DNA polymerase-3 subunit delta'
MTSATKISSLNAGERRVLENVRSAIINNNAAHSYIIEGGSGASRVRCALYIACTVTCENRNSDGTPCFECRQCKKILAGEHTDIKIIATDKEKEKNINVEKIRSVRKEAYVLPTDCDYHIYIIAECEKMNVNSQNALLKILEEPPENTLFLLCVPSKEMLLPTVVSRAQSHSLGRTTAEENEVIFREKFKKLPENSIKRLAKLQCIFDKIELDASDAKVIDSAYDIAKQYYIDKNYRITELLPSDKADLILTLSILAVSARDIATIKRGSDKTDIFLFDNYDDLEKAQSNVSMRRAIELYEIFSKAAERVQSSGNVSSILSELFTDIRK